MFWATMDQLGFEPTSSFRETQGAPMTHCKLVLVFVSFTNELSDDNGSSQSVSPGYMTGCLHQMKVLNKRHDNMQQIFLLSFGYVPGL